MQLVPPLISLLDLLGTEHLKIILEILSSFILLEPGFYLQNYGMNTCQMLSSLLGSNLRPQGTIQCDLND